MPSRNVLTGVLSLSRPWAERMAAGPGIVQESPTWGEDDGPGTARTSGFSLASHSIHWRATHYELADSWNR